MREMLAVVEGADFRFLVFVVVDVDTVAAALAVAFVVDAFVVGALVVVIALVVVGALVVVIALVVVVVVVGALVVVVVAVVVVVFPDGSIDIVGDGTASNTAEHILSAL